MPAINMIQLVFRDRLPGGCALTPLVFFFYLLRLQFSERESPWATDDLWSASFRVTLAERTNI